MSKKCTHCQNTETMREVPLVALECEATRQHKIIMYLIYAVMVLAVLLFGSNLAWLFFGGMI